jgi:signal peptidase II
MAVSAPETAPAAVQRRLPVAVLATAAVVVAVDQLTKSWAVAALEDGPIHLFWTVRLNLSFNSGVAFSIGPGLTPWITLVAVVLVGALLVVARRVSSLPGVLALGLVLGGALGNLGDRLFRGHGGAVIDFVDVQWWPIFNVADVAISVGAVLLVLTSFRDDADDDREDDA